MCRTFLQNLINQRPQQNLSGIPLGMPGQVPGQTAMPQMAVPQATQPTDPNMMIGKNTTQNTMNYRR